MNAAVCGTSASFFGRHELSETRSALRTGTAAPEVNCINPPFGSSSAAGQPADLQPFNYLDFTG
jgi:hypothetical protein